MQHIFDLLKPNTPETPKPIKGGERADIVSFFVTEINKERPATYKDKNGKWKTVELATGREVAIRLSTLKTKEELRAFYAECISYRRRHGSFAKRFYTKSSFK